MELQRLKTDLCSLADTSHSGQRFLPYRDSGRVLQSLSGARDSDMELHRLKTDLCSEADLSDHRLLP